MKNELFIPDSDPTIAGYPLSWWKKHHELPLHIFYEPIIRQNLRAFKCIFERLYPKGQVCFAAKACTHKPVLKIAHQEDCGADVASYNEARCALEAGIPASKLDLNGNCKEDFLLRKAIDLGMNVIADCIEEIEQIEIIAREQKKRVRVLLRISGYDLGQVTDDSVFTAGLWTKFGTPLGVVPDFINTLDRFTHVQVVGFHTHIGSQITKVEPYLSVIAQLITLGHLLNQAGGRCEVINIGGGFPVRYVDKSTWHDTTTRIGEGYAAFRRGDLSKSFVWHDGPAGFGSDDDFHVHLHHWSGERFYSEHPKEKMLEALLLGEITLDGKKIKTVEALRQLGEPTLTIEPGRSIMEDSGVTLARVGIVKTVAHHHNLVCLEMGITSHGESLIEKPVKRWEIANENTTRAAKPFEAFIGGNLCFSGDMISKYKVLLQRPPKRGDIILIHHTGAYTSSLFASASNSYPRPARILATGEGGIELLKKRDSYHDIVE
ncbi:MAG: alanine racemase [Methylococcaceae bacterium]|nr:alanine racemase [Methylococcaceae bacterium]